MTLIFNKGVIKVRLKIYDREIEIDGCKTYKIPEDIQCIIRNGFGLIISPNNGNWIVMKTQNQMNIFIDLKNQMSIGEICEKYIDTKKDIEYVILQLEGKHFCDRIIFDDDNSFILRIYLTNNCNLRCSHCFMYADNKLENELSLDEIKQLLSLCSENGCHKVIYTGGEVGTRKDFIDILRHSKSLGLEVQVLTNGTVWNEDEINKLSNYIDNVQISIDGFDEESNSKIRGKGAFVKAMNAIDCFVKTNTSVAISITPTYELLETFRDKYIAFGKSLAEKYSDFDFIVIFGKELMDGRHIKSDNKKNIRMSSTVDYIMNEIYPNNELTTFIKYHEYNKIYNNCGFGALNINSNGDIYFCGRVNYVKKYDNIRNVDINAVLELRKKVRVSSRIDNLKPCKNCMLKYICGGECRVSFFKEITTCDVNNIDYSLIPARICSDKKKEKLYDLMIQSNDYLLW